MNLRDEMLRIRDEVGALTPDSVVTAWTPEDHPFHDRLEWDDSVAGPKWRRYQAHELIRSVRVVYKEATQREAEQSMRAFLAIRGEDVHSYVYEPSEVVAADELLSVIVMREMEREWKQLFRRFSEFKEFRSLVLGDLGEPAA